eukprot:GEMP01035812.1.p1 GENE.GEMP01035812.1~~GEMP01035812.1.p1  ORF type:complete len:530 (+),score=79.79 GEMP01035812.1:161-1750(+)
MVSVGRQKTEESNAHSPRGYKDRARSPKTNESERSVEGSNVSMSGCGEGNGEYRERRHSRPGSRKCSRARSACSHASTGSSECSTARCPRSNAVRMAEEKYGDTIGCKMTSCLDELPAFERTFVEALGVRRKLSDEQRRDHSNQVWDTYLQLMSSRDLPSIVVGKNCWDPAMHIASIFLTICIFAGPFATMRILLVSKTTNEGDADQLWQYFAQGLYTDSTINLFSERAEERPRGCMPRLSLFYPKKRTSNSAVKNYCTYKRLVLNENRQNVWKSMAIWHFPEWRRRSDIGPGGHFGGHGRRSFGMVLALSIDCIKWDICVHIHGWYGHPDEFNSGFVKNSAIFKCVPVSPVSLETRYVSSIIPSATILTRKTRDDFNALLKFSLFNFQSKLIHDDGKTRKCTKEEDVYNFWEAGASYYFCLASRKPDDAKYECVVLFQLPGSSREKKMARVTTASLLPNVFTARHTMEPFGPELVKAHFRKLAWRKLEKDVHLEKVGDYVFGSEYHDHYTFHGFRRDGWLFKRPASWE